jgi:ribosomal protein L24
VKRGKYRDAVAYLFDAEQSNNFVTVLIPPRDFPYEMPKGSVALFDPSRLPPGISTTDVTRDGEIVAQKYKGEEYYGGLLKKSFHRYSIELVAIPHPDDIRLHIQAGWDTPFTQKAIIAFSKLSLRAGDSVRLHTPDLNGQICTVLSTDHAFGGTIDVQFELDGVVTQTQTTLVDVERVFNVGDEVRVLAGVYQGVEGHLVQKYEDNYTICQAGTQQEVSSFH